MSKPYNTQREIAGLVVDVLEMKFTPEESQRFHTMSDAGRRRWLQDAGFTVDTYYWTNDQEGNVYYYEAV